MTIARPKDYAEWGASRGLSFAQRVLTLANRHARRAAIKKGTADAKPTAAELRSIGASKDEADLYVSAFSRALAAQLGNPSAKIEIVVK